MLMIRRIMMPFALMLRGVVGGSVTLLLSVGHLPRGSLIWRDGCSLRNALVAFPLLDVARVGSALLSGGGRFDSFLNLELKGPFSVAIPHDGGVPFGEVVGFEAGSQADLSDALHLVASLSLLDDDWFFGPCVLGGHGS